jgi:hypothetical protein
MRLLADRRITMGFAAQDTARARRLVGGEALLVTNIQTQLGSWAG